MNNKSKLLIASILACVTAGGVAGFVAGANANIAYAAKSVVPHKIEFGVSELTVTDTGDDFVYFDLLKTNATMSGDSFGTVSNEWSCGIIYGDVAVSSKTGGHMVTADSNLEFDYGNAYLMLPFHFDGIESFQNIILHGKFYDNAYLTNPKTEVTIDSSEFSGGDVNVYTGGYYKIVLDSVEVNYSCLA